MASRARRYAWPRPIGGCPDPDGRLAWLAKRLSQCGDNAMAESEVNAGVRFGGTVIETVVGELIDQPVQALIYPANCRGVMGAGSASSVRLAGGQDVEREIMGLAPLDLGQAAITTAGRLIERHIEAVIHAVIVPSLGDTPRQSVVERALDSALTTATHERMRTLAMPLLGMSAEAPDDERTVFVQSLVDVIVSYVRRPGTRIDRVVIVTRFEDDRSSVFDAINRARQRLWIAPA
jgi:O-acetyl-ADP-ribose deacetylase (regulator of RNase III)